MEKSQIELVMSVAEASEQQNAIFHVGDVTASSSPCATPDDIAFIYGLTCGNV